MHRRLILVTSVALALLGGLVDPVLADGTGDAYNDGDEIGAGARDVPDADGGDSGGTSFGSNPCHYELMDEAGQRAAQNLADGGWGDPAGEGPGAYYQRICDIGGGQTSASVVWLAEPPVDPAALAQQAFDSTIIPAPAFSLNPPPGHDQVVNVPTWMWIDPESWVPVSASASAGAVTVTATATPSTVTWDMGNGDVVVCNGPGVAFDANEPDAAQHSDCTYTYRRSSASQPTGAFTMTVTMTWDVSWTATGAPGGGSLGTASRTTTSPVRVAEIQAVNG